MAADKTVDWTGLGRWLSFAAAGILIIVAIPLIFVHATGAVAGWNIFLGLLLFGSVASGNIRAPTVAAAIFALMAIRLTIAIVAGAAYADIGISALLLAVIGFAAWDLRQQRQRLSA